MESVQALIDVGPDHASIYLLELYPNAPLKEDMARAGWSQAPDDDAAEMYLQSLRTLDAAGYRQYEISNVAKPGRESRHNLKYWEDGEWLGFGCGAHSTRGGERWKNVSGTEEYVTRVTAGGPTAVERSRPPRGGPDPAHPGGDAGRERSHGGVRVSYGNVTRRARRAYGRVSAFRGVFALWYGQCLVQDARSRQRIYRGHVSR